MPAASTAPIPVLQLVTNNLVNDHSTSQGTGIIGIGLLLSVFGLVQLGWVIPFVITAVYGFVSIRYDGFSLLDFLRFGARFFVGKPQLYEWRAR